MQNEHTPILRPEDLYKQRRNRDTARLKTYNQILEQIYHKIQTISCLPTGNISEIIYSIPDFIFGLPRIDLEDCVVYLVYQLRIAGFEVKYTYPNLLYVSWAHHERNYLLEQSPILQAMVDSKEIANRVNKNQEKKYQKISKIISTPLTNSNNLYSSSEKNSVLNISRAQQNQGHNSSKSTQRDSKKKLQESYPSLSAIKTVLSAKDYTPPTSFMEIMEKPRIEKPSDKSQVVIW